jgi:hypothetical protein
MAWVAAKPAGTDAANTIDDSITANNAALDTWANGFTPGIASGAPSVLHCGGTTYTQQKQAMVRVTNSASQDAVTNETSMTWDTETYDTTTMHSTSSNTNRLVAPVAGKYAVIANIAGSGSDTHIVRALVKIKDDSGTVWGRGIVEPYTADLSDYEGSVIVQALVNLSASGWVEVTVDPSGIHTLTVSTNSSFTMFYVGE